MTNPNKAYESGHWRAFIDSDPLGMQNVLFVMKDDYIAKMSTEGGLSLWRMDDPARMLDNKDCMFAWSSLLEDDIIDMWKAIGKALDVWNEQPGRAYAQGYAEGEAKVLREWNESLRGKALD